MALPDTFNLEQKTPVIWGEAGGTSPNTVTLTLSVDALANAGGRMGAKADLGQYWHQEYLLELWIHTGTAPTAGLSCELYMACSTDNSNFPGKVTGSDAAYPATISANKLQLGAPAAILVATNDANTLLKAQPVIYRPTGRYLAPVLVNLLGQALRDEATASANQTRVILTPLEFSVRE